jgi:hypothetical protein
MAAIPRLLGEALAPATTAQAEAALLQARGADPVGSRELISFSFFSFCEVEVEVFEVLGAQIYGVIVLLVFLYFNYIIVYVCLWFYGFNGRYSGVP